MSDGLRAKKDARSWIGAEAPTLDEFERLGREAFDALPEEFRQRVGEIQIRTGNQTLVATAGEGFADVSAEQVTVMVDSCDFAGSRPNASSH